MPSSATHFFARALNPRFILLPAGPRSTAEEIREQNKFLTERVAILSQLVMQTQQRLQQTEGILAEVLNVAHFTNQAGMPGGAIPGGGAAGFAAATFGGGAGGGGLLGGFGGS